MKAALLAHISLLEVDKAAFQSLVNVLEKFVRISFSSLKSALLAYIRLLEVDKASCQSLVDALGKIVRLGFSSKSF